jgi:hypothetical protein
MTTIYTNLQEPLAAFLRLVSCGFLKSYIKTIGRAMGYLSTLKYRLDRIAKD